MLTARMFGSPIVIEQLLVFIRAPRPGQVKTRLAAALANEAACAAYCQLVQTVLEKVSALPGVQLHYTPADAGGEIQAWLRPGWESRPQALGDLGQRLHAAFLAAFKQDAQRVAIVGSDCPEITAQDVQAAWAALASADVVLGPARDGGYWLVGLRHPQPALFEHMAWGTADVLRETLDRARKASLKVVVLRELPDVDTLAEWQAFLKNNPGRVVKECTKLK